MRRLALLPLALVCAGCTAPLAPDVVITNARVFTNDPARPWAETIAVKGERIVGVGTATEIAPTAGPRTRRIDAGGRVLVPGFNDARVDLPLDQPPTPASLSALDRRAIAQGVTSLQVVAGGPMHTLVDAARQAQRQARWRVIRSPMDGERPRDEKPFLPPQPGERLMANGVAWAMSHPFYRDNGVRMPWPGRTDIEPDRLRTAVTWAYGAEDPLVLATAADVGAYLDAMSAVGVAEVWRRKRPRLDVRDPVDSHEILPRLLRFGVVVTFLATPPSDPLADGRSVVDADVPDSSWLIRLRKAGVPVAFGSGRDRTPLRALADGESWRTGASDRRWIAIEALTTGSAYAEKAERDKGWLGPGTLADLVILSEDIFTVPTDRVAGITSVLTMVGGAIVYDPGVLAAARPR